MRALWKLMISLIALTIGSAFRPPMQVMAQSRADLNRRLTHVESRINRLIVLLDGQCLRHHESNDGPVVCQYTLLPRRNIAETGAK